MRRESVGGVDADHFTNPELAQDVYDIIVESNDIRATTEQMPDQAVPKGRVMMDAIEQFDIPPPHADEAIAELMMAGVVYEPETNRLDTI